MFLGSIIERLSCESDATAALLELNDIVLFAEIDAMARRYDETPAQYVAASASRFAARASSEDWLGLMATIERSVDPARAALVRMVRWGLSQDAHDQTAAQADCGDGCGCS